MKKYTTKQLTYPKKILERSILINDSGYFFDYLFNEENTNNINDAKFDTEEIEIIAYPSYDQILEHMDQLKNSRAVVLLYSTQKKEEELLSTYFRRQKIAFNNQLLCDFLKIELDIDELKKTGEKNYYNRILYVFLKTRKEFNLNPTNLNNINSKNFNQSFSKEDFEKQEIKYSLAKRYLELIDEFDLVSFFSLIYYDLTKFKDEYIELLIKIVEHDMNPNKFRAKDIFSSEEINKIGNKSPLHNYNKDWWLLYHPHN